MSEHNHQAIRSVANYFSRLEEANDLLKSQDVRSAYDLVNTNLDLLVNDRTLKGSEDARKDLISRFEAVGRRVIELSYEVRSSSF